MSAMIGGPALLSSRPLLRATRVAYAATNSVAGASQSERPEDLLVYDEDSFDPLDGYRYAFCDDDGCSLHGLVTEDLLEDGRVCPPAGCASVNKLQVVPGDLRENYVLWEYLEEEQKEAALTLGWSLETWGHETKTSVRVWDELTRKQRVAAVVLNFTALSWDHLLRWQKDELVESRDDCDLGSPELAPSADVREKHERLEKRMREAHDRIEKRTRAKSEALPLSMPSNHKEIEATHSWKYVAWLRLLRNIDHCVFFVWTAVASAFWKSALKLLPPQWRRVLHFTERLVAVLWRYYLVAVRWRFPSLLDGPDVLLWFLLVDLFCRSPWCNQVLVVRQLRVCLALAVIEPALLFQKNPWLDSVARALLFFEVLGYSDILKRCWVRLKSCISYLSGLMSMLPCVGTGLASALRTLTVCCTCTSRRATRLAGGLLHGIGGSLLSCLKLPVWLCSSILDRARNWCAASTAAAPAPAAIEAAGRVDTAASVDEDEYAELTAFLTEANLLKVRNKLVQNEVTFDALLSFTEKDLEEIGINKGPRVKIRATMLTYRSGSSPGEGTRAQKQQATAALPECVVCLEPYASTPAKTPRLLSCGHTSCHNCITNMLKLAPRTRRGHHKVLECPQCRVATNVPNGRAEELTKNYALA